MPSCLRRHAANANSTINAMITAAGTHQLAATQSIQDPDSAGAAAGFFGTTGAGTGAGVDVFASGGGKGVAVVEGGAGAGTGGGGALALGAGVLTAGAGLV